MMKPDLEIEAIHIAYNALRLLDRQQWNRALDYIARRLAADARGAAIHLQTADMPLPTQWVRAGQLDTASASENEVLYDCADTLEIVEVNGITVTSQRFGPLVPMDDGEGFSDGTMAVWFDTQAQAEAYRGYVLEPVNAEASGDAALAIELAVTADGTRATDASSGAP